MIELALVIALAALLTVKEYLTYRERHDMLDRLMARNLQEYKDNIPTPEPDKAPVDDGLRDLDDPEAREEILNGPEEE